MLLLLITQISWNLFTGILFTFTGILGISTENLVMSTGILGISTETLCTFTGNLSTCPGNLVTE